MMANIPVLDLGAQHREIRDEIDRAIAGVVDRSAFVGGAEVAAFEHELGEQLRVPHVVGVANGTDALELALAAVGVGPGDKVLTAAFTFAATWEAIVRSGAIPVAVDIRDDDFTIDVERTAERLRAGDIRALIAVHLYGHPADMDTLVGLAHRHGVAVIEDAAQAHGALGPVGGSDMHAGTIGDAGCFSFYPTKNLGALGDGGAVVTPRAEVAERVRLLANHGESRKYHHVIANGRNSRLDGIQAAVLRVKLRRLQSWNDARRERARRYGAQLSNLPLRIPIERPGYHHVYHQYAIRHPARDDLARWLADRGIGTAVHYPLGLHQQEGFRSVVEAPRTLPVTERSAREVLSLPMSPHLRLEQVDEVCAAVREFVDGAERP